MERADASEFVPAAPPPDLVAGRTYCPGSARNAPCGTGFPRRSARQPRPPRRSRNNSPGTCRKICGPRRADEGRRTCRVLSTHEGLHQPSGCDAPAARAQGGDPHAGRPPQIVGRSAVRAATNPLRFRGEGLGREPVPAVTAIMPAHQAIAPGARTCSNGAPIRLLPAGPGEEFDWSVEPVAGRASDHRAFEGPIAGEHGEAAPDLGGKPASDGAFHVQVGRAVKERQFGPPLVTWPG